MIEEKKKQLKYDINIFLVKYFKWLNIGFVIVILISTYFFVLVPEYKEVVGKIGIVNVEKKQKYAINESHLKKLKTLKAAYENIKPEDKEKINMILPEREQAEDLMTQLEVIVSRNGLLLSSLTMERQSPKSKIKSASESATNFGGAGVSKDVDAMKFDMNLLGVNYSGLKNILNVLETNLRLIDIVNINFDPGREALGISAFVYYLK